MQGSELLGIIKPNLADPYQTHTNNIENCLIIESNKHQITTTDTTKVAADVSQD